MMEQLHRLFSLASERGLFAPLARTGLHQRMSIFADDAMIFLKPDEGELQLCLSILDTFGHASGLRVNLAKTLAVPIRCSEDQIRLVTEALGCPIGAFPCKYLGIPLSIRKLSAAQLHDLVQQVANKLPHWKGATLPRSSRLLLIKSVLCAIPLHAMLALNIPPKTLKAIAKICRGFLWCGKSEANGGQCAVAWSSVCTPTWAGGLGIPDLTWLNFALQAQWPWLQRTDVTRPWAGFDIQIPSEARSIFQAATVTRLGNGRSALFWEDRWLQGLRVQDISPGLYHRVCKGIRTSRTVEEALQNRNWAIDVGPNIDQTLLLEVFELWDRTDAVELEPSRQDSTRGHGRKMAHTQRARPTRRNFGAWR